MKLKSSISIMVKRLGELGNTNYSSTDRSVSCLVFVTGNTNKLKEVRAILSEGGHPIDIDSQSLESKHLFM